EGEERGKESIERAVSRLRALACLHVGVPVPQLAAGVVRKVFVNTRDARVPHVATFFVTEQEPAFPQVLVVRIDAAADMTVAVRPGARLNINRSEERRVG